MMRVGVLYPGSMGTALAGLLAQRGLRVLTTRAGRGPRTQARTLAPGIEVLASAHDVVRESDLVLSIVPPAAALTVAEQVADIVATLPSPPIFVELNAIAPSLMEQIATTIQARGGRCVDGGILGISTDSASIEVYLSGPDAPAVAAMLAPFPCCVLGDKLGQASAFKIIFSGLFKGVTALFYEMSSAADALGFREELLTAWGGLPPITKMMAGAVPTYPQHARRRADELDELAAVLDKAGLSSLIVSACGKTLQRVAQTRFEEGRPSWDMRTVLDAIARARVLRS